MLERFIDEWPRRPGRPIKPVISEKELGLLRGMNLDLTERDLFILAELSKGRTNTEVGDDLGASATPSARYVRAIHDKVREAQQAQV